MGSEWATLEPDVQITLARHLVGAQAMSLAENMECGAVQNLGGPDALRLLAMVLAED
jgi:hypothetical protein